MPAATRSVLRWLHYSSPFAVSICAVLLCAISICFIPPSKRTSLKLDQRVVFKRLSLVIMLSYGFEGFSYGLQIVLANWKPEAERVVYASLCFNIWLVLYLVYADADTIGWAVSVGTWTFATLLETIICLLTSRIPTSDAFASIQLAIRFVRTSLLTSLCIYVALLVRNGNRDKHKRLSLLHHTKKGTASIEAEKDPIAKDDLDKDCKAAGDCEVERRRSHLRRIEEPSGLWGYLQQLKSFIPHLLPAKELRLRLYMMSIFVLILMDRASNLLGPRLLSSVGAKVSMARDSDDIPWRDVLIFIFVVKIPHDIVLVPARRWLSIRLFYWSHEQLLFTAFSHVMGLSLSFHDDKKTAEIQTAIDQTMSLNTFLDELIESTIPLTLDAVVAFGYLTYLFDVYVGLILSGTYCFYNVVTYKGTLWAARARRRYQLKHRFKRNYLYEAVANWTTAFYLNRQDYQQARLEITTKQELQEALHAYDINQLVYMMQTLVMCMGYGAVLLRAAYLASLTDQDTGNFVALLLYWSVFTTPLFKLTNSLKNSAEVLIDAERVLEIARLKPTVTDAEGAKDLEFKGGKIEYRNVSFSYDRINPVVKNLSFIVSPGSIVAFVGQTGSGKTTTCDKLLFRGYDVTEGAILVDDQDVRNITQRSLRETIGIVRQEQSFYNESILEIVRFARLDATDEEVHEACKCASIHEHIMSWPEKYDSKIGERGVKVSGGERQRIAIAQLLLRNPRIVVLDEATSSLDGITESEIQDSFSRIYKGRTTLIVAHRLSTVQHADQIFVLDKGTIVERGTHEDLMLMRGRYYRLWSQKQTVNKLESALNLCKTLNEKEAPNEALVDLDGNESDASFIPDILQVDGAGNSKEGDDASVARTGVRKRIHDLKEKFSSGKKNDQGEDDEVSEGDEDHSPIRVVSPRATEFTPPSTLPTRTFSLHKRSRIPKPISISAPLPHPQVKSQDPASPSVNGILRSSSMPLGQENGIGARTILPQSPSRATALNSHPVHSDEDHEEPAAYHTPPTSMSSRRDGSREQH